MDTAKKVQIQAHAQAIAPLLFFARRFLDRGF
jgi:hypothetical protein